MATDERTNEFLRLRSDPTVERWKIELGRVLNGQRDFTIDQLGSAAEYAADLVRRSTDPAASQAHLLGALNNLVSVWQPSHLDSDDYLWKLLDLVRRYTPPAGFGRIVEFLKHLGPPDEAVAVNAGSDVRLKALHAFQRYFPAPPPPTSDETVSERDGGRARTSFNAQLAAFEIYLDILWDYVEYARYAGYAARILMQLRALRPDDIVLTGLLVRQPAALRGILDHCFNEPNHNRGERALMDVYLHCLKSDEPDLETVFRDEVQQAGAMLTYTEHGPQIETHGQYEPREYSINVLTDFNALTDLKFLYSLYYEKYVTRVNADHGRILQATLERATIVTN